VQVPLWAVGLAVAAVAPFAIKTLARTLEARRRARTVELLARASAELRAEGDAADAPAKPDDRTS
jgi:Tfp pilus assembly protein PilV